MIHPTRHVWWFVALRTVLQHVIACCRVVCIRANDDNQLKQLEQPSRIIALQLLCCSGVHRQPSAVAQMVVRMSENVHVHCLQVPVRHVRSGQHATVALHPSHLPLQPSQATQQFMQPPQTSFTAFTLNAGGSTSEASSTSGTVNQQASLQGLVHQQQDKHWQQQQPLPRLQGAPQLQGPPQLQGAPQLQGTSACSVEAVDSSVAVAASSATSTAASASVSGKQQGAAAEQTLPAGLMSQALSRQSQLAEQKPWQQQQDPYVLDHRIHHKTEEERSGQQQQQAVATAVARHACSLTSDAPVPVPSMTKSATTQSDCTPIQFLSQCLRVSQLLGLCQAAPPWQAQRPQMHARAWCCWMLLRTHARCGSFRP